ncbi:trehalose-phosphatase [Sphingobium xanthum]|uniref:trehalose-phosphatase n=1 Tax=Sphingobium xanthum TaxID=1387165 RepID=UPI0031B9C307
MTSPFTPELPLPPVSLLTGASLFLDIDGTLLDLVDDPDSVVADDVLRSLILHVADALAGRVAIISGRSLAQIEAMFGPVAQLVALSGSHGNEHRWRGIEAHPIRPPSLDLATADLRSVLPVRTVS